MMDLIFDKGYLAGRNFSRANMDTLAAELKLSKARYLSDMKNTCPAQVRDDQAMMAKVGTRGVPAFYINGRFLSGARPVGQFKTLIDEELAKANSRIKGNKRKRRAALRGYYKKWVVKAGKSSL